MNGWYQYEPRRRDPDWMEEPEPPVGGWPKPKWWTADDDLWLEDCRKGGENYAREQEKIRRAAKGEA